MQSAKPENIDQYIAAFPRETQLKLKEIRKIITSVAAKAEETISYGIPAYKLDGSIVIYFAGYKSHVSIYPAPRNEDEFKDQLATYKGGKGTVQFKLTDALPVTLIRKIIKYRILEAKTATLSKKAKRDSKRSKR